MTSFRGNLSSSNNTMDTNSDYGMVTVKSVFQTIPMILVSIAAFIGNSMVLFAIYRFKNLRSFSNMYIGSLAVTDVTASLMMPFSYITVLTNGRWLFGHAMCIINGFLLTLLACASMLTLLVFSMYRCYLITTVQKRLSAVLLGKMVKTSIIGIWILAIIYACPPIFGGGTIKLMPFHHSCIIDFSSSKFYAEFLVVFVFTVPLIVMSIAYIRIVKFIAMHNKTIKGSSRGVRRQSATFAPSSEASVDEGNRYTVMELKRKLDLMNQANEAQQTLQSQLSDALSEVNKEQTAEQTTSEEVPLKSLKPSNINVTFKLNPNQTSEDIATCSQDDPSNADNLSDEEPSDDSPPDNKKTKERFKKISVSSVVQKWRSRVNKQDFLKQYKKRVSHQVHLARILLATVVMFLVCWTPFSFDAFLLGIGYTKERPKGFQLVSHWLAFSNALCNPVIYSLLNIHFREAFKTILREVWRMVKSCNQDDDDDVFET